MCRVSGVPVVSSVPGVSGVPVVSGVPQRNLAVTGVAEKPAAGGQSTDTSSSTTSKGQRSAAPVQQTDRVHSADTVT